MFSWLRNLFAKQPSLGQPRPDGRDWKASDIRIADEYGREENDPLMQELFARCMNTNGIVFMNANDDGTVTINDDTGEETIPDPRDEAAS